MNKSFPLSHAPLARISWFSSSMKRVTIVLILLAVSAAALLCSESPSVTERVAAQTRHRKRVASVPAKKQAPRGSAEKYSTFLHSSDSHKQLACNACHKLPTTWTAKRDFPDAADFPDHDACVRCHRQQFFTRQSFIATGPAICRVCHVRAAPREDARFAFGKPNNSNQALKPKEERQFTIEFPHDKHQNVIALLDLRSAPRSQFRRVHIISASYLRPDPPDENQKANYNNCSICHVTNPSAASAPPAGWLDAFVPPAGTFKTRPNAHDACFDCHWKSQKPTSDDCVGCHKLSAAFVPIDRPPRRSAKFIHEGGKGNHVAECTTCHINITRASTLRGLTPDVPINACAACHRDKETITYGPKIVTIETEIAQFEKTGNCTYCHTSDVGRKKPPASHNASVQ